MTLNSEAHWAQWHLTNLQFCPAPGAEAKDTRPSPGPPGPWLCCSSFTVTSTSSVFWGVGLRSMMNGTGEGGLAVETWPSLQVCFISLKSGNVRISVRTVV